eukprot:g9577.t1
MKLLKQLAFVQLVILCSFQQLFGAILLDFENDAVNGYVVSGEDNTVSFTVPSGRTDADNSSATWLGFHTEGTTTLVPDGNSWYRAWTSRKSGFTWEAQYIPTAGTYDMYMVDYGGTVGNVVDSQLLKVDVVNRCIAKSSLQDWITLGCNVTEPTANNVRGLGTIVAVNPYAVCTVSCPVLNGNFTINITTTTTLNSTAMKILSNRLKISKFTTSVPDALLETLWSSSDNNNPTTDDEKCAVFKDILLKINPDVVNVPQLVNTSIKLRPDLAINIATDSAVALPTKAVKISEYAISTLNASLSKSVILSVVQNVQNIAEFQAVYKPASIFSNIAKTYPHLKNYMISAVKTFHKFSPVSDTILEGNGGNVNLPNGKGTLYISSKATVNTNITVEIYAIDCKYVSTTIHSPECYSILPHTFMSPVVFKYKTVEASSNVRCSKSSNEVSNNWDYIPCTVTNGYAYYTSTSFSVFSSSPSSTESGDHTFESRYGLLQNEISIHPISLARNVLSNDIIGRKPTLGYRSLQVLSNATETLDHSESAILDFAVQSRDYDIDPTNTSFSKSYGVFYSDGHTIYKTSLNVLGGSIRTSKKIISGLATFSIYGTNLGENKHDLKAVYIHNIDCSTLIYYNSSYIECITGEHTLVRQITPNILPTEIVVQTGKGNATKDAYIRNFKVRLSEGYTLPIVSNVIRKVHMFRPNAILVDPVKGEYVYWSDTKEKTIRRARYDGSNVEVVSKCKLTYSVRSMAFDDTAKGYRRIYVTDDNTGSIVIVPTNDTTAEIKTLINGLRDPRGIALDYSDRMIYFTELTGRIYKTSMDGINLEQNPTRPAIDKILLIRRPSNVRLNGITLDLSDDRRINHKIYWTESNTNTIMRSTLDGLRIETIAGLDGSLVFPHSILYDKISKYLYFGEYLGTINRFNTISIAQGATKEPLHEKVLRSTTGQSNTVRDEIMDFTKVGGQYFFSVKD